MTKLKPLLKGILIACLCLWPFFASPSYGASPAGGVTLTQAEVAELKNNSNELLNTIDNQLTTINELDRQLQIAKLTTSESNRQLLEALNIISEQKKQLETAKSLLLKQEQMLSEQRVSLKEAEQYLNEQKKEIKNLQAKARNSTILNFVLGGTAIYFAAK